MKKSILLFATAISFLFAATSCVNSNQTIIQAQAMVANRSCPMEVGNGLTLTKVDFPGRYVVYYYKGEGMYFSQENVTQEMKAQIVQTMQTQAQNDANTKKFIEALKKENVGIIYHYYNGSGMIMDVVIEARDLEEDQLSGTHSRSNEQAYQTSETVDEYHESIDLGLPSGTLWATCNIGGSTPKDYGNYYAWGETKTKSDYSWTSYNYYANGDFNRLTKYCSNSDYGDSGFTDNLITLQIGDDPAASWGSNWCTPNDAQWEELLANTTNKWMIEKGVAGRLFTSKKNGMTIFLPAAGFRWCSDEVSKADNEGAYWSGSLCTDYPVNAWYFGIGESGCGLDNLPRYYGFSVRPVYEK